MADLSRKTETALTVAAAEAQRRGYRILGTLHLSIALAKLDGILASVSKTAKVSGAIIACAVKAPTLKDKQPAGGLRAARR